MIQASKASTIDSLRELAPGARQARQGRAETSPSRFQVFLTYPFVDEAVGRDPQVARNLHMGDYTNLSVKLDLDLDGLRSLPSLPTGLPDVTSATLPTSLPTSEITKILGDVTACLRSGDINSAACQQVLRRPGRAAPAARPACQKHRLYRQPGLLRCSTALPSLPTGGAGLPDAHRCRATLLPTASAAGAPPPRSPARRRLPGPDADPTRSPAGPGSTTRRSVTPARPRGW